MILIIGVMVKDNMNTINKDYFTNLIFFSRKSDFIDSTLYQRIFETTPHQVSEFDDVDFIKYTAENEIKLVNNEANTFLEENSKDIEDIYFVAISSNIYNLFLNEIKIPTKECMKDKIKIQKCKIDISPDVGTHTKYQILSMLAFLNIPLGKPVLLLDSISNRILGLFGEFLEVESLNDVHFYSRNIVLNTIDSPYDILSSTNQINYKQCINSILKYKNLNPNINQDHSRLDNLQYYLIDQQIRIYLYSVFEKIINKNYIKFQNNSPLFDSSGNLFFSILTPCESQKTEHFFSFKQISEYVINQGFFVSYQDASDKVYFGESNSLIEHESFKSIDNDTKIGNEIYSLLFRLCDKDFTSFEKKIDDLITAQKYTELEELLVELIYLN